MRFFSNEAKDNAEDQDTGDRAERTDPAAFPAQRAGSPWEHGPADSADRPPVHEPAPQPTAFGASTVAGAVAASATAGPYETPVRDDDHPTDRTTDAASGIADDRTVDLADRDRTVAIDTEDRDRTVAIDTEDRDRTVAIDPEDRDRTVPIGTRAEPVVEDRGTFDDPRVAGEPARGDVVDVVDVPLDESDTRSDDVIDVALEDRGTFEDPHLAGEPATRRPTSGEPATGQPTIDEPATGQPTTGEPATRQHTIDEPATGQPTIDEPATGRPAIDEPATLESIAEPVAAPVAAPQSVSATDQATGASPLFPGAETQALRDRWRDVQLRFVDDPKGATGEAARLVDEAVDKLTAALRDQRGGLAKGSDDTEALRVELRAYRDILDRLLGL